MVRIRVVKRPLGRSSHTSQGIVTRSVQV